MSIVAIVNDEFLEACSFVSWYGMCHRSFDVIGVEGIVNDFRCLCELRTQTLAKEMMHFH